MIKLLATNIIESGLIELVFEVGIIPRISKRVQYQVLEDESAFRTEPLEQTTLRRAVMAIDTAVNQLYAEYGSLKLAGRFIDQAWPASMTSALRDAVKKVAEHHGVSKYHVEITPLGNSRGITLSFPVNPESDDDDETSSLVAPRRRRSRDQQASLVSHREEVRQEEEWTDSDLPF